MKEKILLIQNTNSNTTIPFYGPSNSLSYWAEALQNEGMAPEICNIPLSHPKWIKPAFRIPEIRRFIEIVGFKSSFRRLITHIDRAECVSIHYMTPTAAILCAFYGRFVGLPVFVHLYFPFKDQIWWMFMKNLASLFIAMTEQMEKLTTKMGISPSKTEILPPPIDCQRFSKLDRNRVRQKWGLPKQKFIIGFHGRLTTHRGVIVLLEALKILRRKRDFRAFFSIAPPREDISVGQLSKTIKDYGLSDTIILRIGKNNPVDVYNVSDVMFFPFITPNAVMQPPLSVLEAMACESVVVSSNFQELGLHTFLEHGSNGFLIPCDSFAIAEHAEFLLDTPKDFLRELGRRARESVVSACSYPIVAKAFLKLVNKC